ncbi:unnamed protein product, partial [marine sediment metagenome]
NQSTNVPISRTNLSIYLSDLDGDNLNWTIESSVGNASYNNVFGNVTSYQEDAYNTTLMGNLCDGDWGTSGDLATYPDYEYLNYTIPLGVSGVIWEVKDSAGRDNYTLHENVSKEDTVRLRLNHDLADGRFFYVVTYDGGKHVFAARITGDRIFYEEAIHWQYNSSNGTKSCYISGLDYNTTYYWYVN